MDWTAIVIAIIGSGALTSLITGLLQQKNKKREDLTTVKQALSHLLLSQINHHAGQYLQQGYLSMEQLEEFNDLYNTYKALGGNGYAEILKAQVTALPLKN